VGIRKKPTDALPIKANTQRSATDDQATRVPQPLPRAQRKCNPVQAARARNTGMHKSQIVHSPFTPTSVSVVATVPLDEPDSPL